MELVMRRGFNLLTASGWKSFFNSMRFGDYKYAIRCSFIDTCPVVKEPEYRALYDKDYEWWMAQKKVWFWPFWYYVGSWHLTLKEAEIWINAIKKGQRK